MLVRRNDDRPSQAGKSRKKRNEMGGDESSPPQSFRPAPLKSRETMTTHSRGRRTEVARHPSDLDLPGARCAGATVANCYVADSR